MTPLRTLAAAALLALAASPAAAQYVDFSGGLNAQWEALMAEQKAQLDAANANATRQAMQDPAMIARYNALIAQGHNPGSLESFAYYYGISGGFSPEGVAAYNAQTARTGAQWQNHFNTYNDSQATYQAEVEAARQGAYDARQELGNALMGSQTYTSPWGTQVLPNHWQANSYATHNGNTYYVDQTGQYWQADPNNSGYWYQLGAPR